MTVLRANHVQLGAETGTAPILIAPAKSRYRLLGSGDESRLSLELLNLLRRDPNRPVVRNAGAGEQRGEQVALIPLRIREVSSRPDRTAALSGNHKGEVLTSVYVPILQPRAPHHDAVVEQRAVTLPQVRHLCHHPGKLPDVEFDDHGDLANNITGFGLSRRATILAGRCPSGLRLLSPVPSQSTACPPFPCSHPGIEQRNSGNFKICYISRHHVQTVANCGSCQKPIRRWYHLAFPLRLRRKLAPDTARLQVHGEHAVRVAAFQSLQPHRQFGFSLAVAQQRYAFADLARRKHTDVEIRRSQPSHGCAHAGIRNWFAQFR